MGKRQVIEHKKWRVIGRGTVGDRSIELDKQKGRNIFGQLT
jgi:hypothetical protein